MAVNGDSARAILKPSGQKITLEKVEGDWKIGSWFSADSASDGSGEGAGASDEDKVRETIRSYLSELTSGDGEKACSYLTGNARRELLGVISGQAESAPPPETPGP